MLISSSMRMHAYKQGSNMNCPIQYHAQCQIKIFQDCI